MGGEREEEEEKKKLTIQAESANLTFELEFFFANRTSWTMGPPEAFMSSLQPCYYFVLRLLGGLGIWGGASSCGGQVEVEVRSRSRSRSRWR